MAIVTLDIEEGHAASHDLMSGWDYTRVAMIESLGFSSSTDDLIVQAEVALIAAADPSDGSINGTVGGRGTKYKMGSSGANVFLKSFSHEVISPNCVKSRIIYRGYPILVYDFDASLNQRESNIDVKKNVISVSYTYPADYGSDGNGGDTQKAGKRFVQGKFSQRDEFEAAFTVHFLVVAGNLTVHARGQTLTLTNDNATNLMTAIGAYNGCCNDDVYTIGVITGTKHQWQIRVRGVSHDQGLTYEASMSFLYRPSGWDKTETFINPDTGGPPPDLIISTKKVTDSDWPEYAGIPPASTPDIGQTIAATADEATFPSFGDVSGATFPTVQN